MGRKTIETTSTTDREIVISRVLNAPRDLVVKAWTDPMHMVRWFGPNGFTNSIQEMDVREGGHIKYIMHGPDGADYPNYIRFKEVDLPNRIAYEHGAFAGDPGSFRSEVTFEAQGQRTKVTLKSVFATPEVLAQVKAFGAVEGGVQTLERLEKSVTTKPKEFVITRTFDGPLDLVWKVNSESRHLKHWWGPKGFTCVVAKMAFVPGGVMHYCLKNDQGFAMWGRLAYRRIVPNESITAIVSFSDENGGITRQPGNPHWPLEMLSTTSFAEAGGKTTVTVAWSPVNAGEEEIKAFEAGFDGMKAGFEGTFGGLGEYLAEAKAGRDDAGSRLEPDWDLHLTRVFDGPKALVYDVFTKPEHLAHWWGPKGFTLPVCEMDFRNGGAFTWIMRAPDGSDHPMRGELCDIIPGESFGFICRLDDLLPDDHEIVARMAFAEKGGKTEVQIRQTYAKIDPALKEDSRAGWGQSFDRIDAYLATRKGK